MASNEKVLRRLKLSDLRMLQAVVERRGMAKAAVHLNISQPAVSKAIATLEGALGVRLLDRTPRGVAPTEFGAALLRGGIAVFDELRQTLDRIDFLSDPNAGQIRIGCSEAGAAGFVPTVIDRFARSRPRVTFEIVTADPATLIDRELPQRTVDLVICAIPNGKSLREFDVIRLFDDKHVVMASKGSKWARTRKVNLANLADATWILPPPTSEPGRLVAEALRRDGLDPQRRVTAFSIPLALHLLATGPYVAVLPQIMAQLSAHLALKVLPVNFPPIRRPVGIVTLKGRSVGPSAKHFMDCAREVALGIDK